MHAPRDLRLIYNHTIIYSQLSSFQQQLITF